MNLNFLMFQNVYELINGNLFVKNDIFSSPLIQFQNYDFNEVNGEFEEFKLNDFSQITSSYFIQSEIDKNILSKGSTTIKTIQKENQFDEPKEKEKLYALNYKINVTKALNFRKYNEVDDKQLTKKKTKRDNWENENDDLKENKTEKKRGRKTNISKRTKIHNKMSPDNIIIKIKGLIFNCILAFLNNIIKLSDESFRLYNVKLLKLNYKYVNTLKREQEIELLNMTLKDIFSKDISPKNKLKYPKNHNKIVIETVLKNINFDENKNDENKDNENKDDKNKDNKDKTILFVFNMTLRDWLDVFTHKKTPKSIINEYNNIDIKNIDFGKIEKSLVGIGVNDLLNNIKKKNNDENYMTHFTNYLYNYESWFYSKRPRNANKKEKEKEI